MLMTIKKRRARSQRCRGAACSCSRSGRPRQRAESRSCRAGHPNDGREGASAAAGVSDASADTNAVSAAQRSLASAQANLDQANAKAASRTVTAPSSGSIVELNAKVGATVTGGMIMGESDNERRQAVHADRRLSKMKVTVQVGEKDIAKIAVGQSADVTYPAFPDIVSQEPSRLSRRWQTPTPPTAAAA